MSSTQQTQKPKAQKNEYSNQSKTAQAGDDLKKGEGRVKNEGSSSSSETKSTKSGAK